MESFQDICDQFAPDKDGLKTVIPEGWRQGRTAYGGLTAGLALEAVLREHDGLPPLRSAAINFVGPVSGDPVFTSEVLRQGRNVTSIAATAKVEGNVVFTANFVFGAARESMINIDLPAPDAPPPEACEPFVPPQATGFIPAFFNRFETQLIAGARPMSGADEGYIRCWSRHGAADSRTGIASLLCLGDVLPPAAAPMSRTLGAISSMTWIFNVLREDISTDDGWWQVESKLTAGAAGYSSQGMRVWNTRGELVVEGMQNVAMFF